MELVVGEMNSRLQTDQLKLVKDKYAFTKLTNIFQKIDKYLSENLQISFREYASKK